MLYLTILIGVGFINLEIKTAINLLWDLNPNIMEKPWPKLSYEKGKDTFETIHLFTQIIGKIKLTLLPWINHSWHVALHITPTGLTTQMIPYDDRSFQIDFDFLEHQLKIKTSHGEQRQFSLSGLSVAEFYQFVFDNLRKLAISIRIYPIPCEFENPIPFNKDTIHSSYDMEQVIAFHKAQLNIYEVFLKFRSTFRGKSSPIQFYWGGFDLALSFFSGKIAPIHPGGILGLPNWVAEEAYNREVSSVGFWIGSDILPEPVFYSYLYPEPIGYQRAEILPEGAYYHPILREFILPYSAVESSVDEEKTLLEFLNCTYQAGADLADWDRAILNA